MTQNAHLAEVDPAGLDTTHDVAKRLRTASAPRSGTGCIRGNLATFRAHLDSHSTVRLTEEVSLIARLPSEYGDRTALFDTSRHWRSRSWWRRLKQFYTVLLADDSPATAPDSYRVPAAVAHRPTRCSSSCSWWPASKIPSPRWRR